MTTVIGDYRYEELLGKGSTAKVYKGQHVLTGELVAVKKVSKRSIGAVHIERITAEVALARRMNHPSIIAFRDFVETDNHLYLITEYCNGGDLATFLQMTGPLSALEAKYYMCQIRDALRYLSELKIVHRDLKPQNLLVHFNKPRVYIRYDYRDISIKLADFGLAREIVPDMTSTLCGSPLFLAPEIINEGRMHARSDLWSLGIILYRMLYGHYPCGEPRNLLELTRVLDKWTLSIPRSPKCCIHQRDLLRRLLQKSPEDRLPWEEFWDAPWLECDGVHCDPCTVEDESDDSGDSDEDASNREASVHWKRPPCLDEDYCNRLSISVPIPVPVRTTVVGHRLTPNSVTDSIWKFVKHYVPLPGTQ